MFKDEMLTIEEVASYLKLKPQTIYKWAQTGKIPGAKFGKEWRFRRSAIETWIDRQISSQTRNSTGEGGADGEPKDNAGRVNLTKVETGQVKAKASKSGKTPRAPKDGAGPDKN